MNRVNTTKEVGKKKKKNSTKKREEKKEKEKRNSTRSSRRMVGQVFHALQTTGAINPRYMTDISSDLSTAHDVGRQGGATGTKTDNFRYTECSVPLLCLQFQLVKPFIFILACLPRLSLTVLCAGDDFFCLGMKLGFSRRLVTSSCRQCDVGYFAILPIYQYYIAQSLAASPYISGNN